MKNMKERIRIFNPRTYSHAQRTLTTRGKNPATQKDKGRQETGGKGGRSRRRRGNKRKRGGKEGRRRKDRGRRPFAAAQKGGRKKPTPDHESNDYSLVTFSSFSGPDNESPVTFGIMR